MGYARALLVAGVFALGFGCGAVPLCGTAPTVDLYCVYVMDIPDGELWQAECQDIHGNHIELLVPSRPSRSI